MNEIGLAADEIALLCEVFCCFPEIMEVVLYGSRAKGTFRPESDVDLLLIGVDDDLQAEAIAAELDELPLPYRFDVKATSALGYSPLREHIIRAGISLYRRDPLKNVEISANI